MQALYKFAMAYTLVTGAAGFIGFHLTKALLDQGHQVIGLDNLNDYYDKELKHARLALLTSHQNFSFSELSLEDCQSVKELFQKYSFKSVLNMAAQAGVRYSVDNPDAYVTSNVVGFLNILEGCRHHGVEHLVFASSSSVYGLSETIPFTLDDPTNRPANLYAATKKSNELMAHSYAHLYGLPCTGLRLFTVYGPWGRPDMALFKFTNLIMQGKSIDVYNHGNMKRDFTYVSDVVDGTLRALDTPPASNPDTSALPYRLYNIGNSQPENLLDMIAHLEKALGQKAQMNLMGTQPGDIPVTFADIKESQQDLGYAPKVSLAEGIEAFVKWYREYYDVQTEHPNFMAQQ